MIKFKKLTILVLLSSLLTSIAVGQTVSEKRHIDSVVSANEKISFSQMSYIGDSLKATYFINPQSESVMEIEVETLDKFRKKWVYWYYLDSNLRPMIVSADRIDGKVFRRATYYFKDGKLVFKEETNVKIDKPEEQLQAVKYLLDRMPK